MERKCQEVRPKIEVVRVSSIERRSFRPLDGVQLRAAYSHVRVGTYCPEPEPIPVCENKPPIESARKFKKNLGPVSRLLRRRHHATCLATKSCDNIYSVNRNSNSLDWRLNRSADEQGLQPGQSGSLDWRVGRSVASGSGRLHWQETTRSAEQLQDYTRNAPISTDHLQTPTTKSKLVSLLRRLSPRLSRPGSKNSLQSSPTVCPWVQVEYTTDSIDAGIREESQETDVSFQQELQLNELRKRMAGTAMTAQVTVRVINERKDEQGLQDFRDRARNPIIDHAPCHSKAVHEDRSEEEQQRRQQRTRVIGGEVAGLEDTGDLGTCTGPSSLPDGPVRSTRRTRPLSLAVQPLNYQRLDPDPKPPTIAISATTGPVNSPSRRHPNMTSQESIGSCSLDVDRSASDRSENTVDSISEKTLHSLNLSCNGEPATYPESHRNGSSETLQKNALSPNEKNNVSNGHGVSPEPEQLTVKKPSYLGLACSISGYSGITRYDSKLREGFRSRDSSPGTRLITRETSPAGFRSNENLSVPHHYPPKSQSISPLAMDRQNGFANGVKEECKVETFLETRRTTVNSDQGYSEVDKATFPDIGPMKISTPIKKIHHTVTQISSSHKNRSLITNYCENSPKPSTINLSNTSFKDTSIENETVLSDDSHIYNTSSSSEKSFIQQRVERLYGPGALAQGFFKRSYSRPNSCNNSFSVPPQSNEDVTTDNANTEQSLKNLPVLRHLTPEFRAQLPVVSQRRPTDGSDLSIKQMTRLTPRKNDVKSKLTTSADVSVSSTPKRSTSSANIPDQQPAAPKVVLPVLELSASSTSIAKQALEAEKVEEKDGHYFLNLLKQETDRLLSLAASVEAELDAANDLPEEAAGKLRSAAGKARLLASQKMQQFEGLCQKNINQVPGEAFPTTNEDLAGFWDMVMLQVVQVNDLFDHIDKLRSSQWQEIVPDKKPSVSNSQNGSVKRRVPSVNKPKAAANTEANKKAREAREQARRQMLEERRRAMRTNAQNTDGSVKIFAPDT